MSKSIHVTLSEPLPLSLQLYDGATNKFVRAFVYDWDTDIQVPGSPFELTHIARGFFRDSSFVPAASGRYYALYEICTDAGFTTPDESYSVESDDFEVDSMVTEIANLASNVISIPTPAQVADAVWDELQSAHTTAGTYGAALQGVLSSQRADFLDVIPLIHNVVNQITNKLGIPATGSVAGDLASILAEVLLVRTKTDNLAFTSGKVHSHVITNADKSDYGLSTSALAAIADAVWDEVMAGHTTVGTTGAALSDSGVDNVAAVANAVWDVTRAGHITAGTFGEAIQGVITAARAAKLDNLDDLISSRSSSAQVAAAVAAINANVDSNETKIDVISAKIGSPLVSLVADLAAIQTEVNKIGVPATGTLSGAVAQVKTDTNKLGTPAGLSVSADIAAIYGRIGAPAGASIAADIAAIKTDTAGVAGISSQVTALDAKVGLPVATLATDIAGVLTGVNAVNSKLGTPAGASVSADIAAVKADEVTLLSRLTAIRAANLDLIDVAVSSRQSTTTALSQFNTLNANDSAILGGIGAIPNNTTFAGIVPSVLVLPLSGSKAYEFYANVLNNDGTPGDPDGNVLSVTIKDVAGNIVVAATNMIRISAGYYKHAYSVNAGDQERTLYVFFSYTKGAISFQHTRITEVQEYESKLDTLLTRITPTRASNLDLLDAQVSSLQTSATALSQYNQLLLDIAAIDADIFALDTAIGNPVNGSIAADIAAVLGVANKIGNPANGTLAADIAAVFTYASKIGLPAGTLLSEIAAISSKLGAPVTSVSADIAAIKTIADKIGVPAGLTVSADIADIRSKLGVLPGTDLETKVAVNQALINMVLGRIGVPTVDLVTDLASIQSKLGVPVVSVAADIATIKAQTNGISPLAASIAGVDAKLGVPVSSLAADLAAIVPAITPLISALSAKVGAPVTDVTTMVNQVITLLGAGVPANVMLSTDFRLNYLDAAISTRATPSDVAQAGGSGGGSGAQDLAGYVLDSDDGILVGFVQEG